MSLSCYVYYRVATDSVEEAGRAARELVSRLGGTNSIRSRLMTKLGEPLLWMEVYEGIDEKDSFLATMHSMVSETGIDRYLVSGSRRHVELFKCA